MNIKRGKTSITVSNILDKNEPNWKDNIQGTTQLSTEVINKTDTLARPEINYKKTEIDKLLYEELDENESLTFRIYPNSYGNIQFYFRSSEHCLLQLPDKTIVEIKYNQTINYHTEDINSCIFSIEGYVNVELRKGILDNILNWGEDKTIIKGFKHFFNNFTSTYIYALDVPVFETNDLSSFFEGAENLEYVPNMHLWDVSNITSFYKMFSGCKTFNQDLSKWDWSNAESVGYMFNECDSFDSPLPQGSLSKVSSVNRMFCGCNIFNQSVDHFGLENCYDYEYMFYSCSLFNKPMSLTFSSNLSNDVNINCDSMFLNANEFNQDLSFLNNRSVYFRYFLYRALKFNNILPINLKLKSDASDLFHYDKKLDDINASSIETWDFSEVIKIDHIFQYTKFKINTTNLNFSNVTSMKYAFYYSESEWNFEHNNLNNVIYLTDAFVKSNTNYQSLKYINFQNVTDISSLFKYYDYTIHGNLNLNDFDFSNVTKCSSLFESARLGNNCVDFTNFLHDKITNISSFFKYTKIDDDTVLNTISGWDISNIMKLTNLFYQSNFTSLDLSSWDMSNITDTSYMFRNCRYLETINCSTWDVSNIKTAIYMFGDCRSFNEDLSNWNINNLRQGACMFKSCYKLEFDISNLRITTPNDTCLYENIFSDITKFLDTSTNWDNRIYIGYSGMFCYCSKLYGDLSNLFSENTYIYGLYSFASGTYLTIDVSKWNTSRCIDFKQCFYSFKGTLIGIENMDISSGISFNRMFSHSYCDNFDFSNWVTNNYDHKYFDNTSFDYNTEGNILPLQWTTE